MTRPLGVADWVLADDGVIVEAGELAAGRAAPDGALALPGCVVAPGFLDLQVNGYGNVDFADAAPDAFARALEEMARDGTVACCPTFVSAPLDRYDAMLSRMHDAVAWPASRPRARVIGAHLEGPFLGDAPGAHPVEHLRPADVAWLEAFVERHPRSDAGVALVTLAPEADRDGRATTTLRDAAVVVALGHSRASAADSARHAGFGAQIVTHLFNGMSGLDHRAPGLAAAALLDERLTPTLIADGVHVDPLLLRLAARCAPHLALVTDAVAAAAGRVGDVLIREVDGAARLADGTLAGSTLTMARAVAVMVRNDVPLVDALAMATINPARVLGLEDCGRLDDGARADVVAVAPDGSVQAVWIDGRPVP